MEKTDKEFKSLTAKDQMIFICKTIWSSRTAEQLNGCINMLKNYIKEHGEENIGITFIQLEITRQKRLNDMFAKMQKISEQHNKETDKKMKKIPVPSKKKK